MKNLNKIVLAGLLAVVALVPQDAGAIFGLTTLKNGLGQIYAAAGSRMAGWYVSALNSILHITNTKPLHLAIAHSNLSEVKRLTTKNNGTNIDAKNWLGYTPAHFAVKQQNLPMVKYLTYYGANLKLTNIFGETASDLSKKYKNKDIAEFFKSLTPKKEVKQ